MNIVSKEPFLLIIFIISKICCQCKYIIYRIHTRDLVTKVNNLYRERRVILDVLAFLQNHTKYKAGPRDSFHGLNIITS